MKHLSLFCIVYLVAQTNIPADDNWPRFRGPNGTGISSGDSSTLPLEWSDEKNLKWKTKLPGPGSSSPIIWGDRVYVTYYSGYGTGDDSGSPADLKRHLVALDRADGNILWDKSVAAPDADVVDPFNGFLTEHGYASNTPVTDGKRVYCFFGKAGVVAFDWDGKQLWQQPVGTMYSGKRWGSASSPILHNGKVIVKAGDENRAVYAFNAEDGEEIWKAEGSVLEQTYGTPALQQVSKDRTDLIVAGTGEMWGMNPDTGTLRWFSEMGLTGNISSSPVIHGDTAVIFGGFPRTMGAAFKLGMKGDVTGKATLWENVDVKSLHDSAHFSQKGNCILFATKELPVVPIR